MQWVGKAPLCCSSWRGGGESGWKTGVTFVERRRLWEGVGGKLAVQRTWQRAEGSANRAMRCLVALTASALRPRDSSALYDGISEAMFRAVGTSLI